MAQEIDDFSDFASSFTTLFLVILGEFDFSALNESNPVLAPILFFSFVIVVFFVLVNMFIAILSEAHEAVASRNEEADDEFITQMREGWRKRMRALSRKRYQGTESKLELAQKISQAQHTTRLLGS